MNGQPTGLTQTEVQNGASLSALRVQVAATTKNMNLSTRAEGYGAGFVGVSTDDAETNVNAQNAVTLDPLSSILGTAGVDVLANFTAANTYAYCFAQVTGLFGYLSSTANNNTSLTTPAASAQTSLITAGPRVATDAFLQHPANPMPDPYNNGGLNKLALFVDTTIGVGNIDRGADYSRRALAAGGSHGDNNANLTPSVPWSGDVKILSNPLLDPTLVVDQNGNITTDTGGITVRTSANPNQSSGNIPDDTIVVNDIATSSHGQVYVNSPAPSVGNNTKTVISGVNGTWTFLDTLGGVHITNYSPKNLLINNISIVNQGSATNYDVYLQSQQTPLTFSLQHMSAPSVVDIENKIAYAGEPSSDIILNGQIDNPIGTTTVNNERGNILSTKVRGSNTPDPRFAAIVGPDTRFSYIRTNILNITAPNGSIGDGGKRVNVDLVESVVQNTDPGLRVLRPTKLVAKAGGDVYLDLLGEMRHTDPPNQFMTVNVDLVQAGLTGDANILMQGAVSETHVTGSGADVHIEAPAIPILGSGTNPTDAFANFFQPDNSNVLLGLDPGVFADPNQATPIRSIFNYRGLDFQQNRTVPGLVAGNNIILQAANPTTTAPTKLVDVIGIATFLNGDPTHIDTVTSGNITLAMSAGAMRVRTVYSTVGDVNLTAPDTVNTGEDVVILSGGQIGSPGGIETPGDNTPSLAPTAGATDGGYTGGGLAAGTYFVQYTFTYPNGIETPASPPSPQFLLAAGNVPQVALPPLPASATGLNLYLSDSSATPGSARLYATGITSAYMTMPAAASGSTAPPASNIPTAAPTVTPTGGNTPAVNPSGSGPATVSGYLAPGTYYVVYTYTYPGGTESSASPPSSTFSVAAGNIPQVALPLPPGRCDRLQHLPLGRVRDVGLCEALLVHRHRRGLQLAECGTNRHAGSPGWCSGHRRPDGRPRR